MHSVLVLCVSFGVIGTFGSILVPGYETGSLYSGYDGEYAGKYDNYEPRSYAFEYGVSDPHTGDHKNQWETKDKDGTVRGSYSLLEPDGTTRVVDYIADEHGFRAVVKKVGVHGTTVESHGGAEADHAPEVAAAVPEIHAEVQPTIIEEPVAYRSYDGGYEDYTNLKPVFNDIYTKPLEYIQAPRAEGFLVKVADQQEEYPTSYTQNQIYPKAESLKFSLPQEYWTEQYVPQGKYILTEPKSEYPQEKYQFTQEKYQLPEEKYQYPQENYQFPQEKYQLPEEKYQYPQEKYQIPQEKYQVLQEKYQYPQEMYAFLPEQHFAAPKQIQEYVVPEYKAAPQFQAPVPEYKFVKQYQDSIAHEVPLRGEQYVVSQVPVTKGAYSYVQERRFNTPKGKAVLLEAPKAEYNLNLDYHY